MATFRKIEAPPELAGAKTQVLSPDGRTVACRLEGAKPGLYLFEAGGPARPLLLDLPGRRHLAPAWSASGDLLFRLEVERGRPRVGVVPAEGRGSPVDWEGTGIAVDPEGRRVAVADPGGEGLQVASAAPGNAPFREPLRTLGPLDEAEPERPIDVSLTFDGRYALLVRRREPGRPSLWSFPLEGGDAQELTLALPASASLGFSLGRGLLGVLEVRPGPYPASRLYVQPLSAGSLGALRLGPARDLLFARRALPEQRPGFSPDDKRLALLGQASPLPGAEGAEAALELLPTAGGHIERPLQAHGLVGSARFLGSGQVAIDGADAVFLVTL